MVTFVKMEPDAAPPLGGSGQSDIYMGGIGCAGTFGFRAGRHAARSLKA